MSFKYPLVSNINSYTYMIGRNNFEIYQLIHLTNFANYYAILLFYYICILSIYG